MNIKKDHGENVLAALRGIRGDNGHLTITIQLDQIEIKEVGTHYIQDVTAKSRHPLEEGDLRLPNYLKKKWISRYCPTWPAFSGMTLRFIHDFLQVRLYEHDPIYRHAKSPLSGRNETRLCHVLQALLDSFESGPRI